MTSLRALGLDLSITASGWASRTECGRIQTKAPSAGGMEDVPRFRHIADEVDRLCRAWEPHVVFVEAPSYASSNEAYRIGAMRHKVHEVLWDREIPVSSLSPKQIKKFATGNGSVDKDEVIAAAIRTGLFTGTKNDEADAFWLMAAAYDLYDEPLFPRTKVMREIFKKVEKPALNLAGQGVLL